MNIAICDDNLLDRELIVDLLECYFFNKSISYSIDQLKMVITLSMKLKMDTLTI